MNFRQVTLNTQSNNQASLALYDKMGFRRTGETFGFTKSVQGGLPMSKRQIIKEQTKKTSPD